VISTTLDRRLNKVEAVLRERAKRRFNATCDAVKRDLTDEQREIVDAWWGWRREGLAGIAPCSGNHRGIGFCGLCIGEANPPALLRAMWSLVMWHMEDGTPVVLPPDVAQVYVEDPDAWPLDRCAGCRYLLPMRAKLRADGTFRVIASYSGPCPSCGPDGREGIEEAT
jgi:hypothetical protein